MFGKLSVFVNYIRVFDVYIVKRFPSNKLPVAGLIMTYLFAYQCLKTYSRDTFLKLYYSDDLDKKNKDKLGKWNF
jgi:hypothetical protein